jgi:hypothetical protein
MTSGEATFGDLYWQRVQQNASNHAVNIPSLTVGTIFTARAELASYAGGLCCTKSPLQGFMLRIQYGSWCS